MKNYLACLFLVLGSIGTPSAVHAGGWWWPFKKALPENESIASNEYPVSSNSCPKIYMSQGEEGLRLLGKMGFQSCEETKIAGEGIRMFEIVGNKDHEILVHLFGTKGSDIKIKEYRGRTYGDEKASMNISKQDKRASMNISPSSKKLYYVIEVPEEMNVSLSGKNVMLVAKNMAKKSYITVKAREKYSVHALHNEKQLSFSCSKKGPHMYEIDGSGETQKISGIRGINGLTVPYYSRIILFSITSSPV